MTIFSEPGNKRATLAGGSLVGLCAALIVLALAPPAAAAATVTGTWSCCGSGGATAQTWEIEESAGSLSGTAYNQEDAPFSPISGSASGGSVTIVTGPYDYLPSYTATFVGTIAADGETMSGSWSSNGGQEGTWSATRISGSGETEAEKIAKKEKEEAANKRNAAIQVNCDAFEPDLPSEYFQCTAQVADVSGKSPPQRPTGVVEFAINAGGSGYFKGPSSCSLSPSPGEEEAFCAVDYAPLWIGSIPIGSQPPITATYPGSSVFAATAGQPKNEVATTPLSEEALVKSVCRATYFTGCAGIVAPPPPLATACLSLTGCGSGESGSGSGEGNGGGSGEDVTISTDASDLLADASCPSSGAMTPCELKTYMDSDDPDVALKEKVQYEKNYNTFTNFLSSERSSTLTDLQESLQDLSNHGNAVQKQIGDTASLLWTKYVKERYDEAEARGQGTVQPIKLPDAICGTFSGDAVGECQDYVASINSVVNRSLEAVMQKKESLGVQVPFVPRASSKSGGAGKSDLGAGSSSAHKGAKHRVPKIVLAESKKVVVGAGKRAKVKLAIPALERAKLRHALAEGRRALKAELVVLIAVKSGASTLQTSPVKLRLVAKKHH